jgi:hypothetical protein
MIMIKHTLIIVLLLVVNMSVAQDNKEEINNISLSVILPDNSEYLTQKSLSKIESKIQHIVSRNGISGKGYSNEFLIYPKFEIFNESIIEGMRNIIVVEVELNLFIQQYSTKKIFSSYYKSLKGTGATKEKAITNAVSKITLSDKKLEEFIVSGKDKILNYYKNNCNQIIGDADAFIRTQKYQQAIALLTSVPKEATACYASIQEKSVEAYNAYQEQRCKQNILIAKSKIANNSYSAALRTLSLIDVSSSCSNEAENLIRTTANKVDEREQKHWNLMLKKYNDRQNMQKYRLDTMKEISKAYYSSKPTTVIYKSLF